MPNRAPFGPLFLFSSAVIHSIHAEMACFAKLELYNFLQRGSAPESEEKYGSTQHASIRFVGLHVLYALMGRVVRQNVPRRVKHAFSADVVSPLSSGWSLWSVSLIAQGVGDPCPIFASLSQRVMHHL